MSKIELSINPDRMTLDDLIMMDELSAGKVPAKQLKDFVSRFLIGEDGKYLPHEEAYTLAGKLTMTELRQASEAMSNKVKELQATAIPPATSGG